MKEWEGKLHLLLSINFNSFCPFSTKFQVNSRILVIFHKFNAFNWPQGQNAIFKDFPGFSRPVRTLDTRRDPGLSSEFTVMLR